MILYDFLRKVILPLETIDSHLKKKGKIFDLGCGEGIVAKYLARLPDRVVVGVDLDEERLAQTEVKNLKFITADIRKFEFKTADGVVISDVLHHLATDDQKKLLIKVAKNLKKGGALIIKEIDTKEYVRSKLSRLWDFIFYAQDKIFYWDSDSLKNLLTNLGFKVKLVRASRLFPGSTTVFICKK